MPCRFVAGLSTLVLAPLIAGADTYPVNPAIDIIHYRFELTLSDATEEMAAVAGVKAKFLTSGIEKLRLDLVNRTDQRDGRGMTVSAVTHNRSAIRFRHENDVLLIDLPAPSKAGQVLEFSISYSGIPVTGLLIKENKYGDLSVFSDNWPDKARHWLPTVDHISDKATSEFLVMAPDHWQVVSNGLLQEHSSLGDGMNLTHWKQSVPIAPWLYVLAAADFAVQYVDEFEHKSIQTWVYRQDREAGFYDFAVPTRQVLEYMSNYVGPFAYEKLANIQGNSVGGGMEAASAILYGDDSVTGKRTPRWRYVIVHELAHQWFGNAVTEANWDDVWLSEGFATYFSYLYFAHADGHDAFVKHMMDARDQVFEFYADEPGYRIVHDNLGDMSKVTTPQIYNKGAWVLHMLRNRIGDENWWAGIRNYYTKYMNDHASTTDFRLEMESVCDCDLGPFFDQWLYQGGNIVLDGEWHYDGLNGTIDLSIAQVQSDGFRFTPDIEIGVFGKDDKVPSVHHLSLGGDRVHLSIPVAKKPASVVIDPRTVLLAQWTLKEVVR